jgi:hypothetical protein
MPNHDIKKFYSDPSCAVCNRQVKGWARAYCDNCGRPVCRKHRPLFVQYWQCPGCVQAQQSFLQQPNQVPAPSANSIEPTITQAANHLNSGRISEAQAAIDKLFVDIFGKEE